MKEQDRYISSKNHHITSKSNLDPDVCQIQQ